MKWYNIILVGIILIGIVLVQRKFFPEVKITTYTDTITKIINDTIYKDSLVPYLVKVPEYDTIQLPADSVEITRRYLALHKEFYTENFFKDSTVVDSMGYYKTSFKVTQNKVLDYKTTYSLQQKKIISTTTIANVKNSLYIGGFFGSKSISPTIMLNVKNRTNYFVSYNLVRGEVNGGILINMDRIW